MKMYPVLRSQFVDTPGSFIIGTWPSGSAELFLLNGVNQHHFFTPPVLVQEVSGELRITAGHVEQRDPKRRPLKASFNHCWRRFHVPGPVKDRRRTWLHRNFLCDSTAQCGTCSNIF